jgi:hypothetical protein
MKIKNVFKKDSKKATKIIVEKLAKDQLETVVGGVEYNGHSMLGASDFTSTTTTNIGTVPMVGGALAGA